MRASEVLVAVRRRAGLTQQELAERSGTSQSAIASYEGGAKEPGVDTLDRLVGCAGFAIAWTLRSRPATLPNAIAAIRGALARHDDAEALRQVAELVTALARSAARGELAAAIAEEPPSIGDERWDALLAGVVEGAAYAAGLVTPGWCSAPQRFLRRWWFVSPYRSLWPSAFVDSPPALASRGVFLHAASLASV